VRDRRTGAEASRSTLVEAFLQVWMRAPEGHRDAHPVQLLALSHTVHAMMEMPSTALEFVGNRAEPRQNASRRPPGASTLI